MRLPISKAANRPDNRRDVTPALLNERPVPDGTGRFFMPTGATGTRPTPKDISQ
ncbi:hypothetical protein GCM10023176_62290 [Micromonospora coerulea]|uniref:Uncharacterized protein n=1 Tax=Micromonospora coerulea TaxID=47856 RepID=A0ABP8T991_9ACTN